MYMVRHSRRSKRGGDKLDDIQSQLDSIQLEVNQLKSSSSTMEQPVAEEQLVAVGEPVAEAESLFEKPVEKPVQNLVIEKPVTRSWLADKDIKFKDGAGGRVSLSFPRIMDLFKKHINTDNNTNKDDKRDWVSISNELNNADSISGVQDIINKYKLSFSSNYVAGTRKRRRVGKRKTHRRR